MDNLTHSLVGLAAAKAGLERASPYATAMCLVAANAPDADLVTLLAGRWVYLEYHRGITHSIIGTFALAVVLPALVYGGERLLARLRRRTPRARFRGLLLASLILSASHPLLDWTNSYGVRPLLPWNQRWYYGDLVFILDPWLWLSVGGAAFLLTAQTNRRLAAWALLALVLTGAILVLPGWAGMPYPIASRALWIAGIGGLAAAYRAQLAARWGASVAALALALIVVYWGALALAQRRALALAHEVARSVAEPNGEKVIRVAAMPVVADPLHWSCIAETERALLQFDLSVLDAAGSAEAAGRRTRRYEKPQGKEAALKARAAEDPRAEVFLSFARFPAARVVSGGCVGATIVQFADLRFTEPGGSGRSGFAVEIPVAETPDLNAERDPQ